MRLIPIVLQGKVVDAKKMRTALQTAIDKTVTVIASDFKRTTKTWKRQPEFVKVKAQQSGGDIQGASGTNNEIYGYVTRGTRPHIIRPRKGKLLRFQGSYKAKTRPRVIGSSQGGASGNFVLAKEVRHPGTVAREFEEEIAARRQLTLEQNVTIEISKATQ